MDAKWCLRDVMLRLWFGGGGSPTQACQQFDTNQTWTLEDFEERSRRSRRRPRRCVCFCVCARIPSKTRLTCSPRSNASRSPRSVNVYNWCNQPTTCETRNSLTLARRRRLTKMITKQAEVSVTSQLFYTLVDASISSWLTDWLRYDKIQLVHHDHDQGYEGKGGRGRRTKSTLESESVGGWSEFVFSGGRIHFFLNSNLRS